jgi:hypothetical protein
MIKSEIHGVGCRSVNSKQDNHNKPLLTVNSQDVGALNSLLRGPIVKYLVHLVP